MGELSRIPRLPGIHTVEVPVAAIGGGSTGEQVLLKAYQDRGFKLVGAAFSASAAVTGDDANNFGLQVRNRTKGTVALTKNFVTGEDIAQWGSAELDPSATESDLQVDVGDVLTLEKVEAGTGLALPAGSLALSFKYE